jgi:hypothetical protein
LENTDFSNPSDNPLGQIIIRNFDFVHPLGMEDGASINEIVTVVNRDSMSYVRQTMDVWYPLDDVSELLEVSAVFIVAAKSGAEDLAEGGGLGSGAASSAVDRIMVNRSLASAQQMGESGLPIAGAGTSRKLRAAHQLAVEYGGDPGDWAKMVSSSYRGTDDYQFQTHWYENTRTGLRVEWKTKLTGGW